MKFKLLLTIAVSCTVFINAQKIGLSYKCTGPYKIIRKGSFNVTKEILKDKEDDYYNAIQFLATEKINPSERIKNYYIEQLKAKNYEVVIINEKMEDVQLLTRSSYKQYIYDLSSFKQKYGIDKFLMVDGYYGLEIEKIFFADAGQRNHMFFKTTLVDVSTNLIKKDLTIGDLESIFDLDQDAPEYPNLIKSMDKLINDKVFPKIKKTIAEF